MEYEINYLILQSNTSDLAKLRQEMEDLIKSCGCEVLEKKEYLKRKLAYEINREGYGFHTVLRFKFPEGEVDIEGLKKKLNLNFKVARYLIIRPDGLSSLKDLDKKQEEEKKEETLREKKTVVKQEEVEKIVAEEKVKKTESEIKTEKKKDEIKREDIEKIKETEEVKEIKDESVEEDKKEEKISVDILSDDSTVGKGKKKSGEEDKEDEAKDKKAKGKKADKEKDKVSLDDLDEKLDEILNI